MTFLPAMYENDDSYHTLVSTEEYFLFGGDVDAFGFL